MTYLQDITDLLESWRDGDTSALEKLFPLVYSELRRIAHGYFLQERRGFELQPTDIVHEAYFKLVDHDRMDWKNRAHFFAIAAKTMRRLIVDHARSQRYQKRGGGALHVPLELAGSLVLDEPRDLLVLDECLEALTALDPEKARIVELRYFAGLSVEETAEAIGTSRSTIVRQWRTARAWLFRAVTEGVTDIAS